MAFLKLFRRQCIARCWTHQGGSTRSSCSGEMSEYLFPGHGSHDPALLSTMACWKVMGCCRRQHHDNDDASCRPDLMTARNRMMSRRVIECYFRGHFRIQREERRDIYDYQDQLLVGGACFRMHGVIIAARGKGSLDQNKTNPKKKKPKRKQLGQR